jgi:hypothetical protein
LEPVPHVATIGKQESRVHIHAIGERHGWTPISGSVGVIIELLALALRAFVVRLPGVD